MAEKPLIPDDAIDTEQEIETFGYEIMSWQIPEYHKHQRGKWWYIIFSLVAIGFTLQALLTANFMFALVLVIGSLAMVLNDARHPKTIAVLVTTEGIIVGNNFYDYDSMKNFAIVYKPAENLKRLYIIFKSGVRHRLSVALEDANPLFLRQQLVKYIPEDPTRVDEPTSEALSRLLRL